MLDIYYNFFKKFCDTDKYDEFEMDNDFLCLALSEEKLENGNLPKKRAEWVHIRSKDCTDNFSANASDSFFHRTCYNAHEKLDRRDPGLFEEQFRCAEMLCLSSKTYCCYDWKRNKYNFKSKGHNKRTLEDCWDGPMSKYSEVLQETVNVTSTNRGFRTIQHNVATYEQTKKGLSYFFPKTTVEEDGIHTKALHL